MRVALQQSCSRTQRHVQYPSCGSIFRISVGRGENKASSFPHPLRQHKVNRLQQCNATRALPFTHDSLCISVVDENSQVAVQVCKSLLYASMCRKKNVENVCGGEAFALHPERKDLCERSSDTRCSRLYWPCGALLRTLTAV